MSILGQNIYRKINDPRFSELGDIIVENGKISPWYSLPFKDQQEDIQQILDRKRSFGESFDSNIFQSKNKNLSDITKEAIRNQIFSKSPLIMSETRKPNFREQLLYSILGKLYDY
jgi:hypothetical protein